MKKFLRMSILLVVVALVAGCTRLPDSYPFVNKNESIERVAFLYHPQPNNLLTTKDYLVVRELTAEETDPFMDALQSLKTDKCITPPPRGYGDYVVRISYSDGSMEIFGNYHIEFVKSGEEEAGIGTYVFSPYSAFEELFLAYSGDQDSLDEVWQNSEI